MIASNLQARVCMFSFPSVFLCIGVGESENKVAVVELGGEWVRVWTTVGAVVTIN